MFEIDKTALFPFTVFKIEYELEDDKSKIISGTRIGSDGEETDWSLPGDSN